MSSKREKQILNNIVEILKTRFNPEKIILFGSRAKKEEKSRSDFDIALNEKKPSIGEIRKLKREIEQVSGLYKVDVIFLKSVEKDFRDIILKTGRIIYDKRK